MTRLEVAEALGLTFEQVRYAEVAALRKLARLFDGVEGEDELEVVRRVLLEALDSRS